MNALDEELAGGAVWLAETIRPWIEQVREGRSPDRSERADALVRTLARRVFRLAAVLTEEGGWRGGTIHHHASRLAALAPELERLVAAPERLGGLSPTLVTILRPAVQGLAEVARLVEGVPPVERASHEVTPLPRHVEEDLEELRDLVLGRLILPVIDILRYMQRRGGM